MSNNTDQKSHYVVLPTVTVNKVLDILSVRPYNEVYKIIQEIHATASEYEYDYDGKVLDSQEHSKKKETTSKHASK